MNRRIFLLFLFSFLLTACIHKEKEITLFSDDYNALPRGPLGSNVGAHTEYHFLHEAKPKGNWAISTFRSNLPESWFVRKIENRKVLFQNAENRDKHWHPMVVAGDVLWENYTLKTSFVSLKKQKTCGVAFRYKNDRCYYLLGVKQDSVFLKMVQHESAFHQPFEKLLAAEFFPFQNDKEWEVTIQVNGSEILARVEDGPEFQVTDSTYSQGKIAFLADGPAYFNAIEISTSEQEKADYLKRRMEMDEGEKSLKEANPKMVLWKKIKTPDFGVSRNLRFGDMNNDGEIDVLVGQMLHHGPKDRNSELSCLTAITFDGEILWQKGRPDPWKTELTSDVAFQIHDVNNDGKNEVIYCMNQQMIIADAKSGEVILQAPTPLTPGGQPIKDHNIFERILGDSFYFCDLQGKGFDGDIILKDRYNYVWAFDNRFNLRWKNDCLTGHYPFAYDVDKDGKDELLIGYTLLDDNGEKLWSWDGNIQDHADGVGITRFRENEEPLVFCAASDEGMIFSDVNGNIRQHYYLGHVQNPAVANFRDDLPGLETVSINFWGNQGIIHLYNSEAKIYHDLEPNQYGSMCLPLNWTGKSEEFFVLNANVDEGGAFDGWGRKVLEFPDDGHPDMCYAIVDITGDCRDEIIVWNPLEIWVYTQSDNPKTGKLYQPQKNPMYNSSNYQATVSLPGWNE